MSTHTALFLFAHQDDEFSVFQTLLNEQRAGRRVVCAYMTSGTVGAASSRARNRESLDVLARLGVEADQVLFVGQQLAIDDGSLMHRLGDAADWLGGWIAEASAHAPVEALYLPAWEGGHPDHDALHAVGVTVARSAGLLAVAAQASLYNAYRRSGPFFNVMRPLAANGPLRRVAVPWRHRVAFLRHCLRYPSQRKTWIGLFPFALLHYLFGRGDALQPVDPRRLAERPHEGRLYYEARRFTTWPLLGQAVADFLHDRR